MAHSATPATASTPTTASATRVPVDARFTPEGAELPWYSLSADAWPEGFALLVAAPDVGDAVADARNGETLPVKVGEEADAREEETDDATAELSAFPACANAFLA